MNHQMIDQLRLPFHPSHLTWKPGATKADKCMALAYADLRAYMNRLDEVCGPEWQVAYEPWGDDRLICRLTIAGVTRSSTGEMDSGEEKSGNGGTVAEAQSFKRACTMFGLGRSLYDLPSPWVDFDPQRKRITESGLAQLKSRYEVWYAKTMAAARTVTVSEPARIVDAETGEIAGNPVGDALFNDAMPYFVRDWHKLTGKEYDLVKWIATLHDKSEGPCSAKQYQYLTGMIDALTNNQHNYMLSLLCQSEISKTNMPGAKVATNLFDVLSEQIKQKDSEGKFVKNESGTPVLIANPNYRADMAAMITKIAQQPVAAWHHTAQHTQPEEPRPAPHGMERGDEGGWTH